MNFLEVGAWEKQKKILHGFGMKGTPGDKITRQDWKGHPIANQGKSFPLLSVKQIHGNGIAIFRGNGQEAINLWEKEGDALITCVPQVAIGVFTADCLPVLLFHPEQQVIAIVHAGWRGTALGIVGKVVGEMAEKFDCPEERIEAALGPCIGFCCYEVDAPVEEAFRRNGLPWHFFSSLRRPGKWSLDLQKANAFILEKAGINKKNINLINHCTSCRSDLFFSYRKEKGTRGRQLNFIALP